MEPKTRKQTDAEKCARWYAKQTPEQIKARKLGQRYHMTSEQWDAMFRRQGGLCAMCGKVRPLHVDHDHACCSGPSSCGNCVHGLICSTCNRFLGKFEGASGSNAMKYLVSTVWGAR